MGLESVRHRRHRHGLLTLAWLAAGLAAFSSDRPPLAPRVLADGIVINVPQRMLFLMRSGNVAVHYPIAVGTRGWPTFRGPFTLIVKETDPVWDVPASIQEEQRRLGKRY